MTTWPSDKRTRLLYVSIAWEQGTMRGISTLSTVLFALLSTPTVFASEQQPFEFGTMSAPQYTLPPLPYAYDVSIAATTVLPRMHLAYNQ